MCEAYGRTPLLALIGVLTFVVAVSPNLSLAADLPDFSGAWESETWSTVGWPTEPPYTSAGRLAQQAYEADPQDDPTQNCLSPALVLHISAPFPHEIIQQEHRVTFLYESFHQVRRVWLDERDHPEDAYPTLMGHSIGWWEGDTLVVDTRNVEAGHMRPQGLPHTEGLHVIERYTLLDDGERKQLVITLDDPAYYREPWSVTKTYARFNENILDYDCVPRLHVPGE